MAKYRGFKGEVPTLGNLALTAPTGYAYTYPELYASTSYRGALQAKRIEPVYSAPAPVAQVSPLVPPPVQMVPPSPYIPPVTIAPPVPGTGPVDVMQPDIFSDDYLAPSPVSIGPTSVRGAGPAGSTTPESTAFPYGTNGGAEIVNGKAPALGGAAIFAAIALFVLMGG